MSEPKYLCVKNWEKFQRYHDHEKTGRRMEWLKLYPALLDDADFSRLSDEAKMMWPMFLMLAGVTANRLPNNTEWTRNRLQFNTMRLSKIRKVFDELISIGFLIPIVSQCGATLTQNREEENREEKIRKEKNLCTDAANAASLPTEKTDETALAVTHGSARTVKAEIQFNYNTGSLTGVSANDIADWERAYPAVDVRRNVAAAVEWLRANPQKRKKNLRRFLVNWMSRAQERGGDVRSKSQGKSAEIDKAIMGALKGDGTFPFGGRR